MQEPLRWVIVLVLVLFCGFYHTISETKANYEKQKFVWLTVLWTGKSKGREGTDVCLASGEGIALCPYMAASLGGHSWTFLDSNSSHPRKPSHKFI